ncbi:MAG: ATP-binding protein [Myxococcales bacterium]|nr:ATP-binding protein [Myxococcales bacterium]
MRKKLVREVGNWVSGDKFWGREIEIQNFIELLDEGAHILLTAPRRTGKTSLMREVSRRLEQRGKDLPIYVDLERSSSPEDAIVELSLATVPHRSLWNRVREGFRNFAGRVDELKTDELTVKLREGTLGNWIGKGDHLLDALAAGDLPVVLFLDEFPILINRMLKSGSDAALVEGRAQVDAFISWVRAATMRYPGRLRIVLSGSIGLEPVLRQAGLSAAVNTFHPFELEPWDPDTAAECIAALAENYGLRFESGAINRMTELLGLCVPHHVQMFFAHVYDDGRKRWHRQPGDYNDVTVADVQRVYDTRMLSNRGHAELSHYEERLRSVVGGHLLPLVLDLLSEAAHGELTDVAAAILVEDHTAEEANRLQRLRDVLGILEHDGYLRRTPGGYAFASRLLRDWWKARFGFGFIPAAKRRTA